MRSYIFTLRERELIARWFNGELKLGDKPFSVLVRRVRSFKRLMEDVDLYVRLRESVAAKTA